MRKIISAMRISVDGYIEDPEGRQTGWIAGKTNTIS
jgi:hypothetical protein